MTNDRVYLSIVVPVWNGTDRLSAALERLTAFVGAHAYDAECIVVDDCSGARTVDVLDAFERSDTVVRVLHNDRRQGKGYSVARGMLAARGQFRVFTDADLAYPAAEICSIVRELEAGNDLAIACRVLPESRFVMSPTFFPYLYTRHVMSRAYNHLVRGALLPGILDTQAGLKGFTGEAAQLIFSRLTIPGFGFDVECLYVARQHRLRIKQTPVTFCYDDEPSTVRFARDGARMLGDLARIRWNAQRNRYA